MRRLVRVDADDHFHEPSSVLRCWWTAVGTPTCGSFVLVPLSSHTTARSLPEHFVRKPDPNGRQALREQPDSDLNDATKPSRQPPVSSRHFGDKSGSGTADRFGARRRAATSQPVRRRCLQTSTGKGRSRRSESRKGLEKLLVIWFGQPLVSYQVAQASRLSTMRLAHSGERADPQPAPAYSSASSPPSANSLKLSRSAMFSG